MVESSASQIVEYPFYEWENAIKLDVDKFNDITSKIIDVENKVKNKVGRKRRLTEEKYLNAVRRLKSSSDSNIGKYIGMDRTTVYYFRKNNPAIFEKALNIINEMDSMRFDSKYVSRVVFKQLPTIIQWHEMLIDREVKKKTRNDMLNSVYNVCKYLKIHPDSLTMEQTAKLCNMMKKIPKEERGVGTEYYGLAYYSIRKSLRSFFQLIRGISRELLTAKGIDAGRSEGTGSAASEKVTGEQRDLFEDELRRVIDTYTNIFIRKAIDKEMMFREVLGASHFMYYTGTRIGVTNPTEAGTLSIMCNNPKHVFENDLIIINLLDKGKKSKYLEWNKMLMDNGIIKFTDYITNRFDIQKRNLNTEMLYLESPLFPTIQKHYKLETKIMKETLIRIGCRTHRPNHIWRHTFAQDCLSATDWNYELVASIGGWKDTGTLKLSYGEMNKEAKERGLRKAMGLPVEDVTHELRW